MPSSLRRRVAGTAAFLVLALGVLTWAAPPAAAHPLGNFTTNRYARIEAGGSTLRIHYVLDEAELVAFQERAALARGREAFAAARAEEIGAGLRLQVDGERLALRVLAHDLSEPPGQGGLSTLRLEVQFEAALPRASDGGAGLTVAFEDGNQPNRIGWREVVVRAAPGSRLVRSDAPEEDRTSELRRYPEDRSVPPLDIRTATFTYVPGAGGSADPAADARLTGVTGRAGTAPDRLVGLVTGTTSSPLAIASALLLALAFGGAHALGPGHGKTVMAAYLVSTRGRRRDAVYLGGIVSLMHTASVLALAVVLATVGRNLDAARIYPSLTALAGVLVTGVGIRLLIRRWRSRGTGGPAPGHDHSHGAHDHGGGQHDRHDHDHEHEHEHDHEHEHEPAQARSSGHVHGPGGHTHELPAEVAPLSRAGLIALGTSGGLFPSPSAVVVLIGAFALGRAPFGVALIAAFSVGLALVLVAVGLLLVAGRDRIAASSFALRLSWLPLVGAAAITLLGVVLLVQGYAALR